MKLTEHTLVFVQTLPEANKRPADTGVSWEVRHPEQKDQKKTGLQRLFVVPVCSAFSLDTTSYHRFLEESGALEQVRTLLAESDLHTADGAALTRKKVQACIIAAEVDSILDTYRIEA